MQLSMECKAYVCKKGIGLETGIELRSVFANTAFKFVLFS